MDVPVLRPQEISAIRQKHLLDSRFQNYRAHRPLLARAVPSPACICSSEISHELYHPQIDCPLRVCHENMHAVFRVLFIFALGVQHELLEDVIIPCDDAVHNKFNQ
jgi:hypothetical protein